jgi:hypothetical protein
MGTILVIGDGCLSRNSRTEWLSEGPVVALLQHADASCSTDGLHRCWPRWQLYNSKQLKQILHSLALSSDITISQRYQCADDGGAIKKTKES